MYQGTVYITAEVKDLHNVKKKNQLKYIQLMTLTIHNFLQASCSIWHQTEENV